jgi:hypothetical protein
VGGGVGVEVGRHTGDAGAAKVGQRCGAASARSRDGVRGLAADNAAGEE